MRLKPSWQECLNPQNQESAHSRDRSGDSYFRYFNVLLTFLAVFFLPPSMHFSCVMESKTAHKQKYMLEGKMRIIAMKVIQLNIANSTAYPEFDFFAKHVVLRGAEKEFILLIKRV